MTSLQGDYAKWHSLDKIRAEYCDSKRKNFALGRIVSNYMFDKANGLNASIDEVNTYLQSNNLLIPEIGDKLESTSTMVDPPKVDVSRVNNKVTIKIGDYTIKLPVKLYNKLYRVRNVDLIHNMLIRYAPYISSSFWSIPQEAYKVLKRRGFSMECFASPLNHNLNSYFSLFPDTDRPFGSSGNFFSDFLDCKVRGYVINPPFTANMLTATVELCVKKLTNSKCTILFYAPKWAHLKQTYEKLYEFPYQVLFPEANTHYVYDHISGHKAPANNANVIILVSTERTKDELIPIIAEFYDAIQYRPRSRTC